MFKHSGRHSLLIASFAFTVAFLGGQILFALDPSKSLREYTLNTWRSEDGLPQNSAQALAQTRDGYLWIGTQEGLVRFNGFNFTVFNKGNTSAIRQNDIRQLHVDSHGTLWIGTFGGGLISYKDGQFTLYENKDGLLNDHVGSILEDRDGALWVGTQKGLFKWENKRFVAFDKPEGLPESWINGLALDLQGRLWVGTRKGIAILENGRLAKLPSILNRQPSLGIRQLFRDQRGAMWIATDKSLVQFFEGKITSYSSPQGLPNGMVNSFTEDRAGTLWVGTASAGVCRLRKARFECFTTAQGLGGNSVQATLEDVEGSLWVGAHMGGLNRLKDGGSIASKSLTMSTSVWAVAEGQDGSIWIGSEAGLKRWKNGKLADYFLSKIPAENFITAMFVDPKGNIWVGTNRGVVARFSQTGIKTFTQRVSGDYIYSIRQDHTGTLWIATEHSGLIRLADGHLTSFTTKNGLPSNAVMPLQEASDRTLWIGTNEGLVRWKNGKFTTVKSKGANFGDVVTLYEDSNRVLWIGTYGTGLQRLRDGIFSSFGPKDGLPDDSVWGILEDGHNNFWLSSNRGVSRINRNELNDYLDHKRPNVELFNYGVSDGMPSVECNGGSQPAAWKTRAGQMLFTNARGVVVIDPEKAALLNHIPPPVKIELVTINRTKIQKSNIRVPVGKGDLEFTFAALSYLAPEKIQFKYKLEGWDKDWISSGNRHEAFYTNIPPGSYTFQAIAANNDGLWNNDGAAVTLYLEPHYYQTIWFFTLCGVAIILLGAGIYLVRMRQIRYREDQLVSLVNERTKELQKEILERKRVSERAEAATRAKSLFLANMSHEIRTPLNGVMGMVDLALSTQMTQEQQGLLGMARDSANILLVVINDILDFSKIEAGKLELERSEFDLAETVAEATRTMASRAHGKGLEIHYHVAPEITSSLIGDAARLKQVLINLIGNAIKFTPTGSVTAEVEILQQESGTIHLKFSVADTGIGIPKEKQQSIFDAFEQADPSHTRKFGGTGLGLAISSRIVELLGGRIWVESEPGKGSVFFFTTVCEVSERPGFPGSSPFTGVPILIVEDRPISLQMLHEMALSWGMAPTTAVSTPQALQLAKTAATSGNGFALAVADFSTIGTKGLDALLAETNNSKSILLLNTQEYQEISIHCAERGVGACLVKPVKPSELLAAITRLLPAFGIAVEIRPASRQPRYSNLKILLAEDNLVNRKLATRILENMGNKVSVAETGKEAFEILQREHFDLVFMDIQMPEMDGYSATKAVREWEMPQDKHVPIIAMTANAMKGDREACLAAGMDGYIAKPIKKEDIAAAIERAMETSKSADSMISSMNEEHHQNASMLD